MLGRPGYLDDTSGVYLVYFYTLERARLDLTVSHAVSIMIVIYVFEYLLL